jgi:quercetin dioxygenase-like cupin family protein
VIEHVLVVEGSVEVLLNGLWKPLAKGEGLRFDAHQSHGYRNLSVQSSTLYDIIHYPSL